MLFQTTADNKGLCLADYTEYMIESRHTIEWTICAGFWIAFDGHALYFYIRFKDKSKLHTHVHVRYIYMQLTIRTQSQHDGVETSFHMKDTNFDITFRNVGSVVDERYSLGGARVQGWPPGTWEYVSGRRHRPRRGSRKRPVGNWILQTRSMIIINQFKASLNWFLVSCQVFFFDMRRSGFHVIQYLIIFMKIHMLLGQF